MIPTPTPDPSPRSPPQTADPREFLPAIRNSGMPAQTPDSQLLPAACHLLLGHTPQLAQVQGDAIRHDREGPGRDGLEGPGGRVVLVERLDPVFPVGG